MQLTLFPDMQQASEAIASPPESEPEHEPSDQRQLEMFGENDVYRTM